MTNTYQASVSGFVKHLKISEEEAYDLIKKSVDYAKIAYDRFIQEYTELKGMYHFIFGKISFYIQVN